MLNCAIIIYHTIIVYTNWPYYYCLLFTQVSHAIIAYI